MTTRATLLRKLRNRVPELNAADIWTLRPFVFAVAISPKKGCSFDLVESKVRMVLEAEKTADVGYEVVPFDADQPRPVPQLPARLGLAAFATNQSRSGIRDMLLGTVHDLATVVVEERPGLKVTFRVARDDGSAPEEFLGRVRTALSAIGYAGFSYEVQAPDPNNPRHRDMSRAGVLVPHRDRRVVEYTEEDENSYALRIRRLVEGEHDAVPLVDEASKFRVYLTPSARRIEIGALLPLYERVYVQLPKGDNGASYFQKSFGLSEDDFVLLCKAGAVVPVFTGNLGHYPVYVARRWLEDPSLPFVSPRDADYIAMRHLWRTAEHIRLLREQPELLTHLDEARRRILSLPGDKFRQIRWLYEVLGWVGLGAEQFEGIAFHRGMRALANLSAGGATAQLLSVVASKQFQSKAVADTVAMDGFTASQNIAVAQAFGSSLSDGLVINDAILKSIAPLFQEAVEVRGRLATRQLTEVVKALEIHHSSRVPVGEYLSVINEHQVARTRRIVDDLLSGVRPRGDDKELRERIRTLNSDVARLDSKALRISAVDVIGDISSGLAAANGAYGMALIAKLLGATIPGKLAAGAIDAGLDGPAGAAMDTLRGALNRVQPHAVRIFRMREKLRR